MTNNQIRVFKDTKKRANQFAEYTSSDGTRYPWVPSDLLEVIDLPFPPEDYSDETYYRTEQDTAPYVIYTRKSDEVIQQLMLSKFISAMESYYDEVAKVKRYDSRFTCTLRAGYPGPFQAEGIAFATWMDNCNAYGYIEMEKVLTSVRPMPTVEELLSELPEPPWALPEIVNEPIE